MADDVDFGTALSCVSDIASDGRMVSGFRVVGESIARRWMTPRGRLIGYPEYGFDVTAYVNCDVDTQNLTKLHTGAEAEAVKDERVESCSVSTSLAKDGTLTLTGIIYTSKGPFTLVCKASELTLELLSITPGTVAA